MELELVLVDDEIEDAFLDFQAREKHFKQFVTKEVFGGKLHSALRAKLAENMEETTSVIELMIEVQNRYTEFGTKQQHEFSEARQRALNEYMQEQGIDQTLMVYDPKDENFDQDKINKYMELQRQFDWQPEEVWVPTEIANFALNAVDVMAELAHDRKKIIGEFSKEETQNAFNLLNAMPVNVRKQYMLEQKNFEKDIYRRLFGKT